MSEKHQTRPLREGYQPGKDEVRKGYGVTQPVDLKNLTIPKNLGTAAVTPRDGAKPSPLPTSTNKG